MWPRAQQAPSNFVRVHKFGNGLSVVIELKMCGKGYAAPTQLPAKNRLSTILKIETQAGGISWSSMLA